jgi:osmoprotectant transport system ATP-binding protein
VKQIVLSHISKSYGRETALDDVSLSFEDNVTTAVVGRSGSGKSTLLQSINGLIRPDAGDVNVFGAPIDYRSLPRLRRRIGYAVQGTGLFPHQTVRDNITLLARLEGWEHDRVIDRCESLMRLVELPTDYAGRYPHQLSGGEQQRVGLCRAMMLDPPVFLLDEPFGALDPITRNEIHEEFVRLEQVAPRTTILVTHDVAEALRLANRLVILESGRVLQHGPVDEVVARPAHNTVRELLATGRMGGGGRFE